MCVLISQFEPDEYTGQADHRFEIMRQLFKAGCNTAEVFKSGKQIYRQVTKLVEVGIELWMGFLLLALPGMTRFIPTTFVCSRMASES